MNPLPSVGPQQMAEHNLSQRLDALAELVRIGQRRQASGPDENGFAAPLLADAESVLKRAGERLRLSSNHTVVALAGGTGSGKSTLFNALSGATFSPPGVTRPTTRHVHACVWGMQGAAPLLDWLGVQRRHRYARASVLDSGESDLDGLILLDLPDHDSVVTASMAAVDRLSKLADMVIWVLDPQKYADAAVHNRYLIPLAGHAAVFTMVLNQVDTLPSEQAKDCEDDLRRLLDAEGLTETPILPVSARTGAGLGELRALLTDTVTKNRAVTDRIAADIDAMIDGFAGYAGPQVAPDAVLAGAMRSGTAPLTAPVLAEDGGPAWNPVPGPAEPGGTVASASVPPWDLGDEDRPGAAATPASSKPPWADATPEGDRRDGPDPAGLVPRAPADQLTDSLAGAAGLTAVAQAMAGAREAQGRKCTGWPAARLFRGRRDSLQVAASAAGAARQVQQSEVDNALTAFGDAVGDGLPEPWASSLRTATRSNAAQMPGQLATAVEHTVAAARAKPLGWWRAVTAWQWLAAGLAVAGIALSVVIAVARLTGHRKGWIGEVSLIPWLVAVVAAMLVLGFVTAAWCRNIIVAATERERASAEQAMRDQVGGVTHDLVLVPTGGEIDQYERFRRELAVASGSRQSLLTRS